jgi:hypothetical protein
MFEGVWLSIVTLYAEYSRTPWKAMSDLVLPKIDGVRVSLHLSHDGVFNTENLVTIQI